MTECCIEGVWSENGQIEMPSSEKGLACKNQRFEPGMGEYDVSAKGETLWPALFLGLDADTPNNKLILTTISKCSRLIQTLVLLGQSKQHCQKETAATFPSTASHLSIPQ